MLSLVLPKGSLERATLELFDAADLTVRRSSDRDYHASIDDPRIDRVRFLRPQEIPSYLERGLFDLGHHRPRLDHGDRCRGRLARRAAVLEGDLATRCGWCSRCPTPRPGGPLADLPEGVRISTELPATDRGGTWRRTGSRRW